MMVHQYFRHIACCLLLAVLLPLTGCSDLNGTRLEPVFGADVNLVKLGDKIAETLIEQSFPPLFPRQADQPVLITTLVDDQELSKTSDFGRNLQNTITAGFVARGYTAKEMKLRRDVVIRVEQGEFMLTRHLEELARKQKAQAVVVGTYTMANRVMYLSVRMVSPKDRTIRSTHEQRLYLDENTLRMLGLQFAQSKDENLVQPPKESLIDKIFY